MIKNKHTPLPTRKAEKARQDDDNDEMTAAERRKLGAKLAVGSAQAKAGLTYGPFEKGGISLKEFMDARQGTRRASIRVPAILHRYLAGEAKRLGMRPAELMAVIVETHQFADGEDQLIMLAVKQAGEKRRRRKPK